MSIFHQDYEKIFHLLISKYVATAIEMSIRDASNLPHEQLCQSPIYNDSRWNARPQHFQRGTASDLEWIHTPLQPPYLSTDTPLMSYDLNKWKDSNGQFKPEVSPDPCIPYHTKYCSFNKTVWEYDHNSPSLFISPQPCKRAKVPDVSCSDQQDLMKNDTFTKALRRIRST